MTHDRRSRRAHGTLTGKYLKVYPRRNPLLPLWGLACLLWFVIEDAVVNAPHVLVRVEVK